MEELSHRKLLARIRLRRNAGTSAPVIIFGLLAVVAIFGVTFANATRQGRSASKRPANSVDHASSRRQRCDSDQDVEHDPNQGIISPQENANVQLPTLQPTTSPNHVLPHPNATSIQAMMTAMFANPEFLRQMAMAMQQITPPQPSPTLPTVQAQLPVPQANQSPPQAAPPPEPTAANGFTNEQSEWQWACGCTDHDINTYISTRKALELHMANVLKHAMMCPLCSSVYLGDKLQDKKWVRNHTKWYALSPNETIDSLPGVKDCYHNRSWVQEKNGGSSVRICTNCHLAKSKDAETNPRWKWLSFAKAPTQLVTFLRCWLPRQPFEVLSSLSFLVPHINFGRVTRSYDYVRSEGLVSATSLDDGFLGPYVASIRQLSPDMKARASIAQSKLRESSSNFMTYQTLHDMNLAEPAIQPIVEPNDIPSIEYNRTRAPVPIHDEDGLIATAITHNVHLCVRPDMVASPPVMGQVANTSGAMQHIHLYNKPNEAM
ncbi:hypothetical protein Vafri_17419, partial [Volvox africanus]